MGDASGSRFRDVYAPELAGRPATAGGYAVALAWVVAVLCGVGGGTVLATGAAPSGASPVVFGIVAGGGGLLGALVAVVLAVRGSLRLGRYRAARRAGRCIDHGQLAAMAERLPELGELVARGQRAVDRIATSAAFRAGRLAPALTPAALARIDWAVADAAMRCVGGRSGADRLADEVSRLERLADTAAPGSIDGPDAPVAALANELDRATLMAAELERLRAEH